LQAEVIPDCGGDIQAGATIKIRFLLFVLKNVLVMIRPERSAVFPLRITNSIAFMDCDPAVLTNRLPGLTPSPGVFLLEPWNNQRRFGFGLAVCDVVVRQCEIEWILPRHESDGTIIAP